MRSRLTLVTPATPLPAPACPLILHGCGSHAVMLWNGWFRSGGSGSCAWYAAPWRRSAERNGALDGATRHPPRGPGSSDARATEVAFRVGATPSDRRPG